MVGTRLSQEQVQDLELIERVEQTDRSTTVRKLLSKATREWKVDYFAKQYAEGKLGVSRAASEAGVSIWEMMAYLRDKRIPAQYDLEDLEHDLKVIPKLIVNS